MSIQTGVTIYKKSWMKNIRFCCIYLISDGGDYCLFLFKAAIYMLVWTNLVGAIFFISKIFQSSIVQRWYPQPICMGQRLLVFGCKKFKLDLSKVSKFKRYIEWN